ncbi:MAG: hypothetical protein QOE46_2737 [Acidobacteriota bacterium]|jgi:hypothetical protein|nr:hypothetical protein [Acidobacteriota bacterium]
MRAVQSKTQKSDKADKAGGASSRPGASFAPTTSLDARRMPAYLSATDESPRVGLFDNTTRKEATPSPPDDSGDEASDVHAGLFHRMEAAFGRSFAGVSLLTDEGAEQRAASLDARAYTDGTEIGFARGVFAPETSEGLHTVAHEFAHVAQMRGGSGGSGFGPTGLAVGSGEMHAQLNDGTNGDAVEADADAAAAAVVAGQRPKVADLSLNDTAEVVLRDAGKPKKKKQQTQGTYSIKVEGANSYSYTFNSSDVLNASNTWEMIIRRHFRNIFPTAPADAEDRCLQLMSDRRMERNGEDVYNEKLLKIAKEAPTTTFVIMTETHQSMLSKMHSLYPAVSPSVPLDVTHALGEEGGKGSTAQATPAGAQSGNVETVKGHSIQLPDNLKPDEKEKILKTLEEILVAPDPKAKQAQTPGVLYISEDGAKMLLTVAADPSLLASLKSSGTAKGKGQTFEQLLETIIADKESEQARKRLGVDEPTGTRDEEPIVNRPVHGQIVNLTGHLVPGQEARFSFQVEDDRDAFRVPMISIRWFAYRQGQPSQLVDKELTKYVPVRSQGFLNDRIFNVTFDHPGDYDIEALVQHNFFLPAAFKLKNGVTVITETALAANMNKEELEGFTADTGTTKPHLFQSEGSIVGSALTGPLGNLQVGTVTEGKLDLKAVITKLEDRLKYADDEEKRIEEMISKYQWEQSDEAKQIVQWAQHYLKTLKESKGSLVEDKGKKGRVPLGVKGVFVSRETDVETKPLDMLCYFFRTGLHSYQLILRDFTHLYEQEDYRFEASDDTVKEAEEDVFNKQAEAYPFGTLSLTFQQYDETAHQPTNTFIRFERITDTPSKRVKEFVFGTGADIFVNLVAAVMMLIPGLQLAGVILAISYNSAKTVSGLEDAANKGTLTADKKKHALLEIVINVLPLAGKGAKLITIAGKTFHLFEVASLAGNALLITTQGMDEVNKLRDGVIKRLADVDDKIRDIEKHNKADKTLDALKADRKHLIEEGEHATITVFTEMADQQLLQIVGQHLIAGYVSRKLSVGQMKSQGGFRHETNAPPHYDFKEGLIVGDEMKILPADFERLKFQHEQNKALEGLVTDPTARQKIVEELSTRGVEVRMGAAQTGLKQEGGLNILEIAEGTTPADILSELDKVKSLSTPPTGKPLSTEKQPPAGTNKDKTVKPAPEDTFKPIEPPKETAVVEKGAAFKSELPADAKAIEAAGDAAAQAEAHIEAQAKATYQAALDEKGYGKGKGAKDKLNEQGFIDKYKDDWVYNLKTNRWEKIPESRKRPRPTPVRLPPGTDSHLIARLLTGEGSTSTFKKYFEMLKSQGLADDATLLKAIEDVRTKYQLETKETTLDKVRHDLKEKYRPDVMKKMFEGPNGTKLDAQASHEKMLEITDKLAPSDKGTLTEEWLRKTREAAGSTDISKQVVIKSSEHPGMEGDRRLDFVEGDTINEVKSGKDRLKEEEYGEMRDHLTLVSKESIIDVDGKPRQVKKLKWTFTSPEGGRANAEYLVKQLELNSRLTVEVFNDSHQSMSFTGTNRNQLNEFLGKKTK